jgi:tetratricopeptide (TPR) repeat protein
MAWAQSKFIEKGGSMRHAKGNDPDFSAIRFFLTGPVFFLCLYPALFPAQGQTDRIDRSARCGIADKIGRLVETNFLFPDKAKSVADSFRRKSLSESYDSITTAAGLAEAFTRDLQAVTGDKHFSVRLKERNPGLDTGSPLRHPLHFLRLQQREHFGFTKLDWLAGNIAYAEIRRFYPPSAGTEMVKSVLKFISDADAVVLDLRENGGGDDGILAFFEGHFFGRPMPMTGTYHRKWDFLAEGRTREKIDGKRMPDVPLFLLTSSRTFSAAEYFVYDMKVLKRAVIVGEATKGGAHSVDLFEIDDRFEMFIPTARAVNPVTGGNWEGMGVEPDVLVPAGEALEKALELAGRAAAVYRKSRNDELDKAIIDMEEHLKRAERFFREGRNDSAEGALDSFLEIAGKHGLRSEFLIGILAYAYWIDKDEAILDALLKRNTELFPSSSGAHEALAIAYWEQGKREAALIHFKKALEIDPENLNAAKWIKKLEFPARATEKAFASAIRAYGAHSGGYSGIRNSKPECRKAGRRKGRFLAYIPPRA